MMNKMVEMFKEVTHEWGKNRIEQDRENDRWKSTVGFHLVRFRSIHFQGNNESKWQLLTWMMNVFDVGGKIEHHSEIVNFWERLVSSIIQR